MKIQSYYYNCSPEYIASIDGDLLGLIDGIISQLPKRSTQSEINMDLFWLLTDAGWSYDTILKGTGTKPQCDFQISHSLDEIRNRNCRQLCLTSTTLNTRWHADFARSYHGKLVQLEAQFGKVEAMFKDFCGFRIAYAERRLALGIEVVLVNPPAYFAHRRNAIGGMANFDIAKNTLATIGLECPIWLVGIGE